MNADGTQAWSQQLLLAIAYTHVAHAEHGKSPGAAVRFHDRATPYIVHPLWCAATLLQEPALPLGLRQAGALALLWHDTLEDTMLALPADTSAEVRALVEGMTFASFADERVALWSRPREIRLLKLYDKTSNLLDGAWMKPAKWNAYVDHARRLADEVEREYGPLGIVAIARAIALPK